MLTLTAKRAIERVLAFTIVTIFAHNSNFLIIYESLNIKKNISVEKKQLILKKSVYKQWIKLTI